MLILGTFALAAALAVITKKDITWLAGISIICNAMIVYAFLLINQIQIGIYFASIISIIAFLYCLICFWRKREDLEKYVFTVGGLSIFLSWFIIMLNSSGRSGVFGPDPMLWIGELKKVYLTNDTTPLIHRAMPNFMVALGIMASKTWIRWSDSMPIFAKDIFTISLLAPFFSIRSEKKYSIFKQTFEYIMILALVMLFPYIQAGGGFGIFSLDIVLCLLAVMAMVAFTEAVSTNDNFYFCVSLTYLCTTVLVKRDGIIIVGILLLFCVSFLLIHDKRNLGIIYCLVVPIVYLIFFKVDIYALIPIASLIFAFVMRCVYSFIKRIKNKEIHQYIYCIVTICIIIIPYVIRKTIIRGDGLRRDIGDTFIDAIFSRERYDTGSDLSLSLVGMILVLTIVGWMFIRTKAPLYIKWIFGALVLSTILYIFAFYYLYMTYIGPKTYNSNGKYIDGWERYMGFGIILLACYLIYCVLKYGDGLISILIVLSAVILYIDMGSVYRYFVDPPHRYEFPGVEAAALSLTSEDSIAYVHMDNDGFDLYEHFAFSINAIPGNTTLLDISELTEDRIAEIKDQLDKYDYIYFSDIDQDAISAYGDELFGTDEIVKGDVYTFDEAKECLIDLSQ